MNISELPSLTSTAGRPLDLWGRLTKLYADEKFPYGAGEIKGNKWFCGCRFHGFTPSGKTWKCWLGSHKWLSDIHTPGIGMDALGAAWWYVCECCGKVK
jgi:hypothetical protein